jgi:glycosyltransferase involved in cell wall biosynthesis
MSPKRSLSSITVLMPCLNEEETLEVCIKQASKFLSRCSCETEILIADNGSTDHSIEIAVKLGCRVIHVQKKGYGNALIDGCHAAKGELIIMGDSDASYDFDAVDSFVGEYENGADFIIGDRFAGGIMPGAMPWKNRYIGNPILSYLGRLLFKSKVNDFHCGIRAIEKSFFEQMDLRSSGMEFATEMVVKAHLCGAKISEVPVCLYKDQRSRKPHLRPWRDGWRHLRFMLILRPAVLFLYPGAILFLISTSTYTFLFFGTPKLLDVRFGVHSLLFAQAGLLVSLTLMVMGVSISYIADRDIGLPTSNTMKKILHLPCIEIGLCAGITACLFGLFLAFSALSKWSSLGFGIIEGYDVLRLVSLSTLAITSGIFLCFGSLVVGYFSLTEKR